MSTRQWFLGMSSFDQEGILYNIVPLTDEEVSEFDEDDCLTWNDKVYLLDEVHDELRRWERYYRNVKGA